MPAANQGSGPCPREKATQQLANHGDWKVDVGRFLGLHTDGQNLVRGWIEKAANSKPGAEFEAFIYAWIGFNGWASCCCAQDRDENLLHMMMLDDRLTQNYDRITQEEAVRDAAAQFASYWPIFRVSHLDESIRRNRPNHGSRADVVAYYHARNPKAGRAPECHLNHPGGSRWTGPTPSKRSTACGATCSTDRSPGRQGGPGHRGGRRRCAHPDRKKRARPALTNRRPE